MISDSAMMTMMMMNDDWDGFTTHSLTTRK